MEKIHSYKTLFFNIIATINYAFSPAMNKSLHAVLVKLIQQRQLTISQLL